MKFTTAIALTALLGNAAFSNALDVCNRDTNDEPDYGGVCNKVCERPQTGIRNQVKIQCAVDLDGDGNLDKDSNNKNVDCFDPAVSANGCRNVTVKIIYKFLNSNKDLELEIVNGIYGDKDFSWMAFNQSQVNLQTGTKAIFGNTAENFNIEETINTCEPYLVEIKSKMPVPQIVKEGIWEATDETDDYYPLKLRFCNKQYGQGTNDAANCLNTVLSGQNDLDLSTDKCGVSGKILLCDAKCKADWEAAQGGNPTAPTPTVAGPDAPAPTPSVAGPDAPAPTPSVAGPDAPGPSSPKTKAPSTPKTKAPSTPKTKAPSTPKTKAPSTPKTDPDPSNPSPSSPSKGGTKEPTMKGKGTPEPVRRKMKNRKVARV